MHGKKLRLCWSCGEKVLSHDKALCKPCAEADERRAQRYRTRAVLERQEMHDGVCKGVDPVVVAHALRELRRASVLNASELFEKVVSHTAILHVAPRWDQDCCETDEEMAKFVVREAGTVTGIKRLDRAVRLHMKARGLLECRPCVNDDGAPHGSGYFPTFAGLDFAKSEASCWSLKWGTDLADADEDFVDEVKEAARADAGLLLGFAFEQMSASASWKAARFFTSTLRIDDTKVVSALGRALCDRGVLDFRGSRFRLKEDAG